MKKILARLGIAAMVVTSVAGLTPMLASAVDTVSIASADPSTVDASFTPEIGATLERGTDAYIGRTSTYDGPALGADTDSIFWRVTLDGPSDLTPGMVTLHEVGWKDLSSTSTEVSVYPLAAVSGDLVVTGSCNAGESAPCSVGAGFSLDEDDVFSNADKINFDSSAPTGHYTLMYELVNTATSSATSSPEVLGTFTKEFDLAVTPPDPDPTDPMTAEIRGSKQEDRNGEQPGEQGPFLEGWTIYLDTNDNGVLDAGEVSTTTSAKGTFRFRGLAAGTYHVREVPKEGWGQTVPTSGKYDVTLTEGERLGGVWKERLIFGNFRYGSIAGTKWEREKGINQTHTDGPTLAGWTIQLHKLASASSTATDANLVMSTTTDASGNYSFPHLVPSWYIVKEVLQDGWQNGRPERRVRIRSGEDKVDVDFGNLRVSATSTPST